MYFGINKYSVNFITVQFLENKYFVRYIGYKYRLKEKLEAMSYLEYQDAMEILPQELGISNSEFSRYLDAKVSDDFSISVDDLIVLANFFGCRVEELLSYKPKNHTIKKILKPNRSEIIKKLHLVK